MQRICILTFAERPGKVSTSNLRSLNSFLSIAKSQSVPSRGSILSKNWLLMMTAKPRGLLFILYAACETSHKAIIELHSYHTHTHLTALCPGLSRWAGTKKAKPIWILLKQETVSGSGISWAICKSAPRSRQITMPAPHHSVFYRSDALPAAQPTASKHWRPKHWHSHPCMHTDAQCSACISGWLNNDWNYCI